MQVEEGTKEITQWQLASCVLSDYTLLLQPLNPVSKHTNNTRERLYICRLCAATVTLSLYKRDIPFTPKMDNSEQQRDAEDKALLALQRAVTRSHESVSRFGSEKTVFNSDNTQLACCFLCCVVTISYELIS